MKPRQLNLTALAIIGVGIALQAIGGNDNIPTVPPGIVLAVIAFIAVLTARPWCLTNLGWLIPTILLIGGFASDPGLADAITDPDTQAVRVGAIVTAVGYVVAIATGIIASVQRYHAART